MIRKSKLLTDFEKNQVKEDIELEDKIRIVEEIVSLAREINLGGFNDSILNDIEVDIKYGRIINT